MAPPEWLCALQCGTMFLDLLFAVLTQVSQSDSYRIHCG